MSQPDLERVVLLHGILNPRWILWPLARRLRRAGYETIVWAYPGSRGWIETHADRLAAFVRSLPGSGPVHFVGFSLGSIVIRYMLAHHPLERIGRFVMIGPPNQGNAIAQDLYRHRWFRWIYGQQAIRQLFPSAEFYKTCGIPAVPFGIIAGGTGTTDGFVKALGEDNDGTVTVTSTRLEGAQAFVVLPHTHMGLVWSKDTADQVVSFLKQGRFR